jgi:hypothetical protein
MLVDSSQLALILGIGAVLLLVAGVMGVVLAFGISKLSPLPAKPPQEELPAEPVDPATLASRKAAYRLGAYVLIALAVLTALEFAIALVLNGSVGFLFVLALAKAGLILQYYMHLDKVWGGEEAHA